MIITAEYVNLCRKLFLPPRTLQAGDYYANFWDNFKQHRVFIAEESILSWIGTLPDLREKEGCVWLPRVENWLDLLTGFGYDKIFFRPIDNPTLRGWMVEEKNTPYPDDPSYDPRDPFQHFSSGETREMALGRLYQRVLHE